MKIHDLGAHFSNPPHAFMVISMVLSLAPHLEDSVDFVESLLRRQLSACIGHRLTAADVANYMRFHHRRLGLGLQVDES